LLSDARHRVLQRYHSTNTRLFYKGLENLYNRLIIYLFFVIFVIFYFVYSLAKSSI